ncbi:PepSY domain-containing protein [Halobacillus aidingensis]|uniref:Peptidase propeptide and YPEB domain-containing protein n=1 Tax=Halobacillus aidingensis TaxID=240303 RepID=A0A1H0HCC7_HALAD|nr:PepSY domain-containing protein [Halobacillus aidingensis]SDO16778.1 Peptidase propeptide and YPEB domain-containing protein [Halobacillus aidingensis]
MANHFKLLISISLLALLIVLGWQWVNERLSAEPLTESDIREKVQTQYNGEITDVTSTEGHYLATIELEEGVYEVAVLKKDGRISDIKPIKKFQNNDSTSGSQSENTKTQPITEEKAKAVALNEIEGEVDDIDFESEGDPAFYLVEIERPGGEEATVQIHALSGEIMSVTWDD